MRFTNNTRGRVSASVAVRLIVALAVLGLVAAFMLPVAINEIEGDTVTTLTQDVNTDYDVNAELVSNVTAINDTANATVQLNDTRTSGTTSNLIDVGSTTDYALDGGTVTVGVESATAGSPDQAVVNYTYSNDYAYGSGATALWGILGLAIVLAVFLFVVRVGLSSSNLND